MSNSRLDSSLEKRWYLMVDFSIDFCLLLRLLDDSGRASGRSHGVGSYRQKKMCKKHNRIKGIEHAFLYTGINQQFAKIKLLSMGNDTL